MGGLPREWPCGGQHNRTALRSKESLIAHESRGASDLAPNKEKPRRSAASVGAVCQRTEPTSFQSHAGWLRATAKIMSATVRCASSARAFGCRSPVRHFQRQATGPLSQ